MEPVDFKLKINWCHFSQFGSGFAIYFFYNYVMYVSARILKASTSLINAAGCLVHSSKKHLLFQQSSKSYMMWHLILVAFTRFSQKHKMTRYILNPYLHYKALFSCTVKHLAQFCPGNSKLVLNCKKPCDSHKRSLFLYCSNTYSKVCTTSFWTKTHVTKWLSFL